MDSSDVNNPLKQEDDSQTSEEQKDTKCKMDWQLIKTKLVKTDILLVKYKETLKECQKLQEELNTVKCEKSDVLSKYNLAMEKVNILELENLSHKQNIEEYTEKIEKQSIKLEENTQHMNQLNFKISEIEVENNNLKEDKKNLEIANKSPKKLKKSVKHQGSQCKLFGLRSIAVNTDPMLQQKKVNDQSTVTEKQKELLPIFCNKCSTEIHPIPTQQILEVMTDLSYDRPLPQMLTSSPSCFSKVEPYEITATESIDIDKDDHKTSLVPLVLPDRICNDTTPNQYEELAKEVGKMQKILKSLVEDKSQNTSHKHCCSSKNIKFMVQLPSEKRILSERKKLKKRKLKKMKRLNSNILKTKNSKKRKRFLNDNWKVENCLENTNHQMNSVKKKKIDGPLKKSMEHTKVVPESFVKSPIVSDDEPLSFESQNLQSCSGLLDQKRFESVDDNASANSSVCNKRVISSERRNRDLHFNDCKEKSSFDLSEMKPTQNTVSQTSVKCNFNSNSGFKINENVKENITLVQNKSTVNVSISESKVSSDSNNSASSQVPDSHMNSEKNLALSDDECRDLPPNFGPSSINTELESTDSKKSENFKKDRDLHENFDQLLLSKSLKDHQKSNDESLFEKEIEKVNEFADSKENTVKVASSSVLPISKGKIDVINSEEKNYQEINSEKSDDRNKSLIETDSTHSLVLNLNNGTDGESSVRTDDQKMAYNEELELKSNKLHSSVVKTDIDMSDQKMDNSQESESSKLHLFIGKNELNMSKLPASPSYQEVINENFDAEEKSLQEKNKQEVVDSDLKNAKVHKLPIVAPGKRRSRRILPSQDASLSTIKIEKEENKQSSDEKSVEITKRTRNTSKLSYKEFFGEEEEIVEKIKPRYPFRSHDSSKVSTEKVDTEISKNPQKNTDDLSSSEEGEIVEKAKPRYAFRSQDTFKLSTDEVKTETQKNAPTNLDDSSLIDENEIVEKAKPRYAFRSQDSSKVYTEFESTDVQKSIKMQIDDLSVSEDSSQLENTVSYSVKKRKRILSPKSTSKKLAEEENTCSLTIEEEQPSSDVEELSNDSYENVNVASPLTSRRGRKPTNSRQNLMKKINKLGKKKPTRSTLTFESYISQNTDPVTDLSDTIKIPSASNRSFDQSVIPVDCDISVVSSKKRIAHKPKPSDSSAQGESLIQTKKVVKKTRSLGNNEDLPNTDIISAMMDKFSETSKDRARVMSSIKKVNSVTTPGASLRSLGDNISNQENPIQNSDCETPKPRSLLQPLPFDTEALTALYNKKNSGEISEEEFANALKNKYNPNIGSNIPNQEDLMPVCPTNVNSELNLSVKNDCDFIQDNKHETSLSNEKTVSNNLNVVNTNQNNSILGTENEASLVNRLESKNDHGFNCNNSQFTSHPNPLIKNSEPAIKEGVLSPRSTKKQSARGRSSTVETEENEKSPCRKLRSREVTTAPELKEPFKQKKCKTNRWNVQEIDETNSCLGNTAVVTCLNQFLSQPQTNNLRRSRIHDQEFSKNEKFIQGQLQLLLDEEWTCDITNKVAESLLDSQNISRIALVLIEFAADKSLDEEPLDRQHTPPAPLMTKAEQKIIALINVINKKYPEFFDLVVDGIQYKLFRLGKSTFEVQVVESLFRIVVSLAKIKKDRESVRIFICDALYCLTFRAINILYTGLTSWPEIIPHYDPNGPSDVLTETIVFTIMTIECKNKPYPKLSALRKLLSNAYNYPNSGYIVNNFKDKLLGDLKNMSNIPNVSTAILIFCKKQGPVWSRDNIIRPIKYLLVNEQSHPYELLVLLGNILRSFRESEASHIATEVIDDLCYILQDKTKECSPDLQEGIISCLLSITKFKFLPIALAVLNWDFKKELRPTTKVKLNTLFKSHDAKWWAKFVKDNFPPKT